MVPYQTNPYCQVWVQGRVSTGAAGAWHPPKFWTSPLAPADFEVLNTNWHPQSSFYVISGTLSFKFLTQALSRQVVWIFVHKLNWSSELHVPQIPNQDTLKSIKMVFFFVKSKIKISWFWPWMKYLFNELSFASTKTKLKNPISKTQNNFLVNTGFLVKLFQKKPKW